MIRVLFVCMGNICRSPLAEGLFNKLIQDNNLSNLVSCDSAGTASYHIGSLPDKRTLENASGHGLDLNHTARQFKTGDLHQFDYILAMDIFNLEDINNMKDAIKDTPAKIFLMRYFDPQAKNDDVPDPFLGGSSGFEEVYQILERSMANFMDSF